MRDFRPYGSVRRRSPMSGPTAIYLQAFSLTYSGSGPDRPGRQGTQLHRPLGALAVVAHDLQRAVVAGREVMIFEQMKFCRSNTAVGGGDFCGR